MRIANPTSAIILAATVLLTIGVDGVRADKPTTIPTWFNGEIVYVIPAVSDSVAGVTNHAIASKVANPLYVFGIQDHVLGLAIPGVAGYKPWWDVVLVSVEDGRDVSTDPFTSEVEILEAYLHGEVDLTDPGFTLLCQVVSQ